MGAPIPFRPDVNAKREANLTSIVKALSAHAGARDMREAEQAVGDDRAALAMLQRSYKVRGAVVPHTMAGTTTFTATSIDVAVDILGPDNAGAAVLGRAGVKVSFDNPIASHWVPGVAADGAKPSWVTQGNPIRIGQWDTTKGCTLSAGLKKGYGAVITHEMLANSNFEGMLRQKLVEDVGASIEADLFGNAAAVANQRPAGLLQGVQTVNAEATLSGQAALIADMSGLASAVGATGGEIIFVANVKETTRIKAWLPLFPGIYPSGAVSAGNLIAIAPRGIAVGGSIDGARIDTADEATLWLDDAATTEQLSAAASPNTVVAPIRSLWQSDCSAVRLILPDLCWGQRVAAGGGGCVAALTGSLKW
jgi:hypothetical protein